MQKKTSTLELGNDQTRLQFAKNLVYHLHKIGQIKEVPTDEIIEAYWNKLQQEKTAE